MSVIESLNMGYKIAKIIHKIIESTPNISNNWEGHFRDGPNAFYNQMESGFIIEEYYGNLSKLYTNLGEWHILGSGSHSGTAQKEVFEKVKQRLQLKLYKEGVQNDIGYFGPWWIVEAVDNIPLLPVKKKNKEDYMEYRDIKNIWNQKKEEWNL